jgi:hypothetical protein
MNVGISGVEDVQEAMIVGGHLRRAGQNFILSMHKRVYIHNDDGRRAARWSRSFTGQKYDRSKDNRYAQESQT